MAKAGDNNVRAKPRSTTSALGRAYWAFHDRKFSAVRPEFLPWVSTEDLEAVEELAKLKPADRVAVLHGQMIETLTTEKSLDDEAARAAFKGVYDEAVAATLPATTAYLRHAQVINEVAHSHSLAQVQLETLKSIDRAGHTDPAFGRFAKDLIGKLGTKAKLFDVVAYSQFFEIYGEAITLQHLRARPGLKAARVEESALEGESRPDFKCTLNNGAPFYIEVKSLDIVGGEFRQREMMDDGLNRQAELERRREADLARGERVSMVEGEIAPYRAVGQTDGYDAWSLKLVIDTLRTKCRSAFKPSQFEMGPTFALALVDRLVLPGGRHALAPYYYAPEPAGCCLTGVLWHVALRADRHPGLPGAGVRGQAELRSQPDDRRPLQRPQPALPRPRPDRARHPLRPTGCLRSWESGDWRRALVARRDGGGARRDLRRTERCRQQLWLETQRRWRA